MSNSGARAAKTTQACALAPSAAGAIPDEWGGMAIPTSHRLLEPVDELFGALGMLARKGTAHQNALQRLRHVEPGPRPRGVERPDAVLQQPAHQVVTAMAGQIVPDQEEAQGRSWFGLFVGPPPVLPRPH